jgi:acyl-CoA thioester hydrolase
METTADMHFIGECIIPVRWGDLDTYAHVNNSRFFEYMTESRAQVLSHIIRPTGDLQFVLAYTQCSFKKPILYPGSVLIKHYVKHIGHTSFTIICDLLSEDGSLLYAQGEGKLVCFDPVKGKPVAIPEKLMVSLKNTHSL